MISRKLFEFQLSARLNRMEPGLSRRIAALLQCRAIARHASNILPGSGAKFHRAEATRQANHAETRPCLSVQTDFGNGAGSRPPAMRAAKRNGPSVQRGHVLSVTALHDRFVRHLPTIILDRCRPYGLCKIAHFATEATACRPAPRQMNRCDARRSSAFTVCSRFYLT
jgi:hypothetical protein